MRIAAIAHRCVKQGFARLRLDKVGRRRGKRGDSSKEGKGKWRQVSAGGKKRVVAREVGCDEARFASNDERNDEHGRLLDCDERHGYG